MASLATKNIVSVPVMVMAVVWRCLPWAKQKKLFANNVDYMSALVPSKRVASDSLLPLMGLVMALTKCRMCGESTVAAWARNDRIPQLRVLWLCRTGAGVLVLAHPWRRRLRTSWYSLSAAVVVADCGCTLASDAGSGALGDGSTFGMGAGTLGSDAWGAGVGLGSSLVAKWEVLLVVQLPVGGSGPRVGRHLLSGSRNLALDG
jgi:hypothetical protein